MIDFAIMALRTYFLWHFAVFCLLFWGNSGWWCSGRFKEIGSSSPASGFSTSSPFSFSASTSLYHSGVIFASAQTLGRLNEENGLRVGWLFPDLSSEEIRNSACGSTHTFLLKLKEKCVSAVSPGFDAQRINMSFEEFVRKPNYQFKITFLDEQYNLPIENGVLVHLNILNKNGEKSSKEVLNDLHAAIRDKSSALRQDAQVGHFVWQSDFVEDPLTGTKTPSSGLPPVIVTPSSTDGLPVGALIGIIVGCALVIIFIALLIICLIKKRRKKGGKMLLSESPESQGTPVRSVSEFSRKSLKVEEMKKETQTPKQNNVPFFDLNSSRAMSLTPENKKPAWSSQEILARRMENKSFVEVPLDWTTKDVLKRQITKASGRVDKSRSTLSKTSTGGTDSDLHGSPTSRSSAGQRDDSARVIQKSSGLATSRR